MNEQEVVLLSRLSDSHGQLARILETQRTVAAQMAAHVHVLPDYRGAMMGADKAYRHAGQIHESVVSYLNGIGGLMETLSDHAGLLLRKENEEEEEE